MIAWLSQNAWFPIDVHCRRKWASPQPVLGRVNNQQTGLKKCVSRIGRLEMRLQKEEPRWIDCGSGCTVSLPSWPASGISFASPNLLAVLARFIPPLIPKANLIAFYIPVTLRGNGDKAIYSLPSQSFTSTGRHRATNQPMWSYTTGTKRAAKGVLEETTSSSLRGQKGSISRTWSWRMRIKWAEVKKKKRF